MVFIQACRQLTRDMLLALSERRTCELQPSVRDVVTQLKLHRRGRRAGEHPFRRRTTAHIASSSVDRATQYGEIPTVIGNRHNNNNNQLFSSSSSVRSSTIKRILFRGPTDSMRLGLFNARAVSNKSSSIIVDYRKTAERCGAC